MRVYDRARAHARMYLNLRAHTRMHLVPREFACVHMHKCKRSFLRAFACMRLRACSRAGLIKTQNAFAHKISQNSTLGSETFMYYM